MKETDLFKPIKRLLESQGYLVKAEVKDIDVLACKDDIYIAVELKTKISLKLIYQAVDRQKTMDIVYISIPKSSIPKSRALYKQFIHLLKRLEIGLIVVENEHADVLLEASPFNLEKSRASYKKKKQRIIKEYYLRKNKVNVGGTKGKTLTRYKEMVVEIGLFLIEHEQASPKDIMQATQIKKVASILQKNYHQYFERVSRGIYQLTDKGKKEINDLKKQLEENHYGSN